MTKSKVLLTLTGYQITWLVSVFGEKNYEKPLAGFLVGMIYFIIYLYLTKNKIRFIKIVFLIAIPGYIFDTLVVYLSIYEFISLWKVGMLPIWMFSLWLSFATLFDEILIYFKKIKLIGIILSAILGTMTYYIGDPLGIININQTLYFFTLMVIFWSLLMYFYLTVILKYN